MVLTENKLREYVKDVLLEMLAYHGSKNAFKNFNSSFIKSGVGQVVLGNGHYFTNDKTLAKEYSNDGSNITYSGTSFNREDDFLEHLVNRISSITEIPSSELYKQVESIYFRNNKNVNELIREVLLFVAKFFKEKNELQNKKDVIQKLNKELKHNIKINNKFLYKVEIPDENKLFDWDDNVTAEMLKVVLELVKNETTDEGYKKISQSLSEQSPLTLKRLFSLITSTLNWNEQATNILIKNVLIKYGFLGTTLTTQFGNDIKVGNNKTERPKIYTIFNDSDIRITNRWDS